MSSLLPMPITSLTASILALIYVVLSVRVSGGRRRYRISLGDGDNADMLARIRAHANFIEYVPLLLILMALLESSGGKSSALALGGALLVVFRIMHAVGVPRPAPNVFRAVGAAGTLALVLAAGIWGLALAVAP